MVAIVAKREAPALGRGSREATSEGRLLGGKRGLEPESEPSAPASPPLLAGVAGEKGWRVIALRETTRAACPWGERGRSGASYFEYVYTGYGGHFRHFLGIRFSFPLVLGLEGEIPEIQGDVHRFPGEKWGHTPFSLGCT